MKAGRIAGFAVVAAVLATIILSVFSASLALAGTANGKARVIAHTDSEVSNAVAHGCNVIRETKNLKALECSSDAASSLGLQEDVQVFALDSKANSQIKADLVQSSGNTGSGRKIVVLDTGYNYNHAELSSSYLGGKDFVNFDNDPADDNGHGTHVAGIITADGAKAKGVAPSAGIISGKVLDASGSGYFSDVVAGIYWAVDGPDGIAGPVCTTVNGTNTTTCINDDFNADAISLSLGTSQPYTYSGYCDSVLPDLTAAIQYARSRGVLVVVAAGNSGNAGVSIPGCISYSTTVGAVDGRDKIASFSGRGSAVDVTAPGVNIYSAWLGTAYKILDGTSMATPMVSGTVALIKSAHPTWTADQVESALRSTATDLGASGFDSNYGWGRINAQAAAK